MRFVNPKNGVAFKKIFGDENHKEILIAFLNAVLDLHEEREITDIDILNPYQAPKIEALKYTLLDVRARDKRGVTFIVEMQLENIIGYEKRFLYYAAKAYTSQIEQGHDYPRLNQVIFIGILDFVGFESDDYLTRHLILNSKTYKQEIIDLEFNFIQLPKFAKREDELVTLLDKWVYFIKYATDLEVIPDSADVPALRAAYEVADRFHWTAAELEVYDYWSMKAQDERGAIEMARQEGERQKAREMARTMLADGLDPATIMKYTGLSAPEFAALSM